MLFLGDFNAHHHAWEDTKIDNQGEAILRASDNHNLVIMNDGHPTFISSSGHASSSIDLSIGSRNLQLLSSVTTLQDLYGSNFSISISLAETSPFTFLYTNRILLSPRRRMQWVVETRFLLPNFQSRFRNFRSCTDNLIMLTNRINSAFLNKAPTLAVFLDIAGAFDNVIPQILIQDLRRAGFPICFCKFIQNLLFERSIFAARNGDLLGPLIIHKGIPQGSILSPLLFNFYLRNIGNCLHKDTQILQYADYCFVFFDLSR